MLDKCGVACILSVMSEKGLPISRQERFDSLAGRLSVLSVMEGDHGIELMGAFNIERKIGEKAVRFSVFIPENLREHDYSPSILFQRLKVGRAHEGEYFAPESEIYLLRDKLEAEGAEEKLAELEEVLDSL